MLRTDQERFRDVDHLRLVLRAYFGLDKFVMSPDQEKQLNLEVLAFAEYYKGVLDALTNLVRLGISHAEVMNYFSVVARAGGSPRLTLEVLEYTLALTKRGQLGRVFISHVSANATTIGQKLSALNSNSGRVLAFLVVVQVGFHIARGDYAKAIGEIAKAALSTACAPAAFIDLIDVLIGLLLPQAWLNWPPVRVVRGMNPAQCTSLVVENLSLLVYTFCMAKQNNWKAVEDAITKMCDSFERSPAGIFTVLSRDTAMLCDEWVLPNSVSNFEIYGASLRNLADYARAHPTSY